MILLPIPTANDVWRWLTLFCYRRWSGAEGRKPVGVPHNRDPQHPCDSYAPRPQRALDWHDCMTDGHYLCAECAHRAPIEVLARQHDYQDAG